MLIRRRRRNPIGDRHVREVLLPMQRGTASSIRNRLGRDAVRSFVGGDLIDVRQSEADIV